MARQIAAGLLVGSLLLLGFTGQAGATTVLYDGVGFNDGNYGLTFGVEFTPTVDIDVTMLGVLDGGSDGAGMQAAHAVGLWSNDGTLLAQTVVDNSSTLISDFRYTAIPVLSLAAGTTYVVGAYYGFGQVGDKLVATSLSTDPLLGVAEYARLTGGSDLAFPDGTHVDFRMSANLVYTAAQVTTVPVPGALWLFFSGLLGIVAAARRRTRC